jgi:hypothetical protein
MPQKCSVRRRKRGKKKRVEGFVIRAQLALLFVTARPLMKQSNAIVNTNSSASDKKSSRAPCVHIFLRNLE